jgi:hypothetical protein
MWHDNIDSQHILPVVFLPDHPVNKLPPRESIIKTRQCSAEFRFVALTTPGMCPVNALWGWYQMCMRESGQAVGAVFRFSIDWVRKMFQHVAAATIGGVPKDDGLHSLRAGEVGWSISEIMFMGRWRSPTVLVYLRQGDRWLHQLSLPAKRGLTVRPTLFRGVEYKCCNSHMHSMGVPAGTSLCVCACSCVLGEQFRPRPCIVASGTLLCRYLCYKERELS